MPRLVNDVVDWLENDESTADHGSANSRTRRSQHNGVKDFFSKSMRLMETMAEKISSKSYRGCQCDPMAREFSMEGKLEVFREKMLNDLMLATPEPGNDGSLTIYDYSEDYSGDHSGDHEHSDHDSHTECPEPVQQNVNVFNKDGTVRPYYEPHVCAATKKHKKKSILFWVNCEVGKNMSYFMDFQTEHRGINDPETSLPLFTIYSSHKCTVRSKQSTQN